MQLYAIKRQNIYTSKKPDFDQKKTSQWLRRHALKAKPEGLKIAAQGAVRRKKFLNTCTEPEIETTGT